MPTEPRAADYCHLNMAGAHNHQPRELRYVAQVEIEVTGIDGQGDIFRVATRTADISEWGCGFEFPVELWINQIIAIARGADVGHTFGAPMLFQVVRCKAHAQGWSVGAWKIDTGDVWGEELKQRQSPAEAGPESAVLG